MINNEGDNRVRDIAYFEQLVMESKWSALRRFLDKIEEYLKDAEKEFQEKERDIKKQVKESRADSQSYTDLWADTDNFYNIELPRLLHNSALLSAISLFELELNFICKSVKNQKELSIGWKDLKGDTLEQVKLFIKLAKIDIQYEDTLWNDLNYFYLIRNCIIHNNGLILGSKREKDLRNYACNNNLIAQQGDEEITLSHEFCKVVINRVSSFTKRLRDSSKVISTDK